MSAARTPERFIETRLGRLTPGLRPVRIKRSIMGFGRKLLARGGAMPAEALERRTSRGKP